MNEIENIKISQNSTIKEALKIIGDGAMQIAIIVDEKEKLLGTLTDGDIRRGLLKGLDLNSSIESLISSNFATTVSPYISFPSAEGLTGITR